MKGMRYLVPCFILGLLLPIISHAGTTVSVSGISSGAAMAVQYHVAYSGEIVGAGVIAGPPYWCANSNVANALVACMTHPELISVSELVAATNYAYQQNGSIDHPTLLSNTKVWLYSGTQDSVVVSDVSSEHAFITSSYGNPCTYLGKPYINNCGMDAAGEILKFILGKLNKPQPAASNNFSQLHQPHYLPIGVTQQFASMADYAYVYVPSKCSHGVFHGCQQSESAVGDVFYKNAGYNEWAEANDIIVLYPQTITNTLNANGCWDWWGYTGTAYASKLGVQMIAIKNMITHLQSGKKLI